MGTWHTAHRFEFVLFCYDYENNVQGTTITHPAYSSLIKTFTKEENSVRYTPGFTSELTFSMDDFYFIDGFSWSSYFHIFINDVTGLFSSVVGYFRYTDGIVDYNALSFTVTPHILSPYKSFSDKANNEYSILNMGLNRHSVCAKLWPIKQCYPAGSSSLLAYTYTGVYGGNPSVNNVEAPFPHVNEGWTPYIVAGAYGTGQLSGLFASKNTTGANPILAQGGLNGATNIYQIYLSQSQLTLTNTPFIPGEFIIAITRYFDEWGDAQTNRYYHSWRWNILLYQASSSDSLTYLNYGLLSLTDDEAVNQRITVDCGAYGTLEVQIWVIGERIIGDDNTYLPITLNQNTDILTSGYRYSSAFQGYPVVTPNANSAVFYKVSNNISYTDTGYGHVENQPYYYDTPGGNISWQPLFRESWGNGISLWAWPISISDEDITKLAADYCALDYYSFGDIIKGIVAQIDPEIVFEPDNNHSIFLFDQLNPIDGTPNLYNNILMTQKSNFKKLHYDYPAWKANIKWAQIAEFLQHALNCYWDLEQGADGKWHLRIEHILFYLQGRSYDYDSRSIFDTTYYRDAQNRQSVGYHTHKLRFDIDNAYDRFEYRWMDAESVLFAGVPLVTRPEYRFFSDEKKMDCSISWFSSDFDFLRLTPSECSSDGFMIVSCDANNNVLLVFNAYNRPFCQNYPLALWPAIETLSFVTGKYPFAMMREGEDEWLWNRFNGFFREYQIVFNSYTHELDPHNIIATEAGLGIIKDIRIDMSCNKNEVTISYFS